MASHDSVNIGSSNGLLPDGTKPLTETMLACHQLGLAAFIWGQSQDMLKILDISFKLLI